MPTWREKQQIARRVQPDAVQLPYSAAGHRWEERYRLKMDAIKAGTAADDLPLFGGEAVLYLMERQGIDYPAMNEKLGFNPYYLQGNIMPHGWNTGRSVLPEPFRKRMVGLTKASLESKGVDPVEFWCRRNFTVQDLTGIHIDMTRDISTEQVLYEKNPPSPEIAQVLADIPQLARVLLTEGGDGKTWRKGTFLIDHEGRFAAGKQFPSMRYLIEQKTPGEVLDSFTKRSAGERTFGDKGRFMQAVVKTARKERLIDCVVSQVMPYLPLKEHNRCVGSR